MPASQRWPRRAASAARLAGRPAAQLAGRLAALRNQRPKCPTVSTHVSSDSCSQSKIGARSAGIAPRLSRRASTVFPNSSPGPVEQLQVLPLGHRQQFQPGADPFAAMLVALPRQAIVPAQVRPAAAAVHAVINGDLIRRNHIPPRRPGHGGAHWLIREQVFTHPSRKYTPVN
jgi:hypothetical protein